MNQNLFKVKRESNNPVQYIHITNNIQRRCEGYTTSLPYAIHKLRPVLASVPPASLIAMVAVPIPPPSIHILHVSPHGELFGDVAMEK